MNLPDRALLHGATLAVGATGVAHAVFKHLMTGDDPFSAVNHPLQPWALSLHVLAAPILVFASGLIFKDHVVAKYRNGPPPRAKGSGVITLALILPAILSGYLLQVLSEDSSRRIAAWLHLAFGGLLLLTYLAHLLVVPKTSANGTVVEPGKPAVATGLRIGMPRGSPSGTAGSPGAPGAHRP